MDESEYDGGIVPKAEELYGVVHGGGEVILPKVLVVTDWVMLNISPPPLNFRRFDKTDIVKEFSDQLNKILFGGG